jgi:hypothetical protein
MVTSSTLLNISTPLKASTASKIRLFSPLLPTDEQKRRIEAESTFAKGHGAGTTTCFAIEPLPSVLAPYDYNLRHHPEPVPIKVWADYRCTDALAVRLIQLKNIFSANPGLEINKKNIYKALEWLKKAFPMVRQDIRPSVLDDSWDGKSQDIIALSYWDSHEGLDALDANLIVAQVLKPKSTDKVGFKAGGFASEKFEVDPKLKASLGASVTLGIEASKLQPTKPTHGIHIAKCLFHLLPQDTRKTFVEVLNKEQLPGSQLVLGANEQHLNMRNYLSPDTYEATTAINEQSNQNQLRQTLNKKEGFKNPQWVYTRKADSPDKPLIARRKYDA